MSETRPSFEPGLVLAHVSLRVILPLVGGVITGLVLDTIGQTAPQYVLIGLGVGTLVSILWLTSFVVSNVRRIKREDAERAAAVRADGHEHTTTEGA
jgi:hypothetical protein